jgi:hypothetical protein
MRNFRILALVSALLLAASLNGVAEAQSNKSKGGDGRPAAAAPAFRASSPQRAAPRFTAPKSVSPRFTSRPNLGFQHRAARQQIHQGRTHLQRIGRKQQRQGIKTPTQANRLNAPTVRAASRRQLQQMRRLQARQRQNLEQKGLSAIERQQSRAQKLQAKGGQPGATNRMAKVSARDARRGRFASQALTGNLTSAQASVSKARAARIGPRYAWKRGWRAAFLPWYGPLFWPYAYSDIFDYTFWPYAYDPYYWAFAYDDLFDSVFWAYGPPYLGDAYVGAFPGYYASAETTDTAGGYAAPRAPQVARASEELCKDPGQGITAWPFERIKSVVQPTADQQRLLDQLKSAAAQAADAFKAGCSDEVPMTPPGRLEAMINRLSATREAVRIVRGPLTAFYDSLSDEQKARFNEVGPKIGRSGGPATRSQTQEQQANACGEPKPGLTNLPIERIQGTVQPTADQQAALDRLAQTTQQAVDQLQTACPNFVPLTPVGRLEAMEKRLDAMIASAKTVQPALEDFYASLTNEQKARFNVIGRATAQRG